MILKTFKLSCSTEPRLSMFVVVSLLSGIFFVMETTLQQLNADREALHQNIRELLWEFDEKYPYVDLNLTLVDKEYFEFATTGNRVKVKPYNVKITVTI